VVLLGGRRELPVFCDTSLWNNRSRGKEARVRLGSEALIANLLYRYAECIDNGDLEGAAALFERATIRRMRGDQELLLDSAQLLEHWREVMILYPDGTPRTKHVITNPIIEVDEEAGSASCRSYYTVFQQTDEVPLQPVASGRYRDRFERVDGTWRFVYRDYSMLEFVGNISRHVRRYGNQV
jgi:3-phenylpropionate/cinnamic acid dioxygenase small subunit